MNRKEFLAYLTLLAGLTGIFGWYRAQQRYQQLFRKKRRVVYVDRGTVGTKTEGVIFIKEKSRLRAFSSRCTHLGCELRVMPDGSMECPCHGSAFSAEGKVLRGPADSDLETIPVRLDSQTHQYYVEREKNDG